MKFFKWGLMLMLLTLAFFSCKDDESVLGENFLDGTLDLKYDTIHNVTTLTTRYYDTIEVHSDMPVSLIGDYYDPVFGEHKALTAFNMVPESNIVDTGNYIAIGLKLHLEFSNFYGFDTVNSTKYSVHMVTNPLSQIDDAMIGTIDIDEYYNSIPIAETTHVLNHLTRTGDNFLDFELPITLGEELLSNWDSIYIDTAFQSIFYGFVIKAERQSETGGNIAYFKLADTDSKMTLEFYEEGAPEDTLSFDFHISDSDNNLPTMRFNFFKHNYPDGLTEADFTANKEYAYLQAMRGLNVELSIDMEGSDIMNDDLVINRAILRLHTTKREVPDNDTLEYTPPYIFVIGIKDGNYESIPDIVLGEHDDEENIYNIALSAHTYNKIIEGENSFKILVQPFLATYTANRAVFFGSDYTVDSLRPKVYITYSKRSNIE
jgi:hypothetical protein